MSTIRANIEELERTAGSFASAAGELEGLLRRSANRVPGVRWEGQAREHFVDRYRESDRQGQQAVSLLNGISSNMRSAAEILRRIEEEQRREAERQRQEEARREAEQRMLAAQKKAKK
jgi:WXG100 family type VII secretion target